MITSPHNPLVKELKSVQSRQTKSRERFYLIEGVKLVQELFASGRLPEQVIYTEHFKKSAVSDKILKACRANAIPADEISEKAFLSLSTLEHPEGVMAKAQKIIRDVKEMKQSKESGVVVLHEIQDPGNVGTILRLSEAFGMGAVFLGNSCASPYNPKVLRASMGAFFHIPCLSGSTRAFLKWLHENAYNIILADVRGKKPLYEAKISGKCALVFGNESRGLPREFFAEHPETACIPMQGKLNSINVAWACSLFLYERMRQKEKH